MGRISLSPTYNETDLQRILFFCTKPKAKKKNQTLAQLFREAVKVQGSYFPIVKLP